MVSNYTELETVYIKTEQRNMINSMKVHERQPTHEVMQELLEKAALYDKYCLMMGNDCMVDDGR